MASEDSPLETWAVRRKIVPAGVETRDWQMGRRRVDLRAENSYYDGVKSRSERYRENWQPETRGELAGSKE